MGGHEHRLIHMPEKDEVLSALSQHCVMSTYDKGSLEHDCGEQLTICDTQRHVPVNTQRGRVRSRVKKLSNMDVGKRDARGLDAPD